jgi:hypothetical protein
MTLLRSFGQVEDDGKIAVGSNLVLQMNLVPDSWVGLKVIRITGSGGFPYLTNDRLDQDPKTTALERGFHQGRCQSY